MFLSPDNNQQPLSISGSLALSADNNELDARSACSSPSSMLMRMKNTFIHFEEHVCDADGVCLDNNGSPRVSIIEGERGTSKRRANSESSHLSPSMRSRLGSGGSLDGVLLNDILNNLAWLNCVDGEDGQSDFVMVMEEDPPKQHAKRPPQLSGDGETPQLDEIANMLTTHTTPTPSTTADCGVTPAIRTPEPEIAENCRTTVMLRNIPNKFSQQKLMDYINGEGFDGRFDFFYLPIDFRNKCNVGYAFINFDNHETLLEFKNRFDGFKLPGYNSQKVCVVTYARVQGLEANLVHYKNSPVAEVTVPEYRPVELQLKRK